MNAKDKNADWLLKPFQGREPVAWGMMNPDGNIYDVISPEEHGKHEGKYKTALFLTPQYRELSDEEIIELFENPDDFNCIDFARAILRKAQKK